MQPPLSELRGPRVLLRPPRDADKSERLKYGRNAEFVRMVGGDPDAMSPLTVDEVGRWYDQTVSEPYCWSIEHEGRFIGTARLHRLDPAARSAWYAIGLYDPSAWGCGLGTEATILVLSFAFQQLHLRDVFLRVLEYNHRAIAAYRKAGFLAERLERDSLAVGDERYSDVVMRASSLHGQCDT
jgi:RimJ/RimL family protein N-acetyltransferase